MKIIKRNGAEVPFDITKIITAVTKASDSVGGQARLSREQITQIAAAVTDQCQQLNRAVSVEEVQDLVENQLMDIQAHDVARHYITYRYVQSLKRQTNTTDERILSLIECQNEEVKQENANKNPTVNSVQRDYMAGEISKDLTARLLLAAAAAPVPLPGDAQGSPAAERRMQSSGPYAAKCMVPASAADNFLPAVGFMRLSGRN